ncbi:glutathione S-transferase [Apiospora sp. TS-2023a]
MTAMATKSPVLTVYRGWKDSGKHVWSPFVVKLEARLRFGNLAYRTAVGSPKTAPRGKIPYVEFPSGEESLGDSDLIAKALTERGLLPDLNARLDGEGRARDLAVRAMMEDRLCFYHGWERWTQNYYTMRDHIFAAMPYPLRVVIGLLAHRGMVATLHGQGTGRYTADEIASFRLEIWKSINALLTASRDKARARALAGGSKPGMVWEGEAGGKEKEPFWVLGGEGPTEADATVFGFVVSVLICTAGPDSQAVVKGFPVILEYADRIQDRYFPDYVKWIL